MKGAVHQGDSTVKLYFTPGACSFASHIALCEAGLAYELELVDLRSKKTSSGADYLKVNPKGYVPALVLDNGQVLTECAAILQYIGDQKPGAGLTPAATSFERYRLQEWLNFVATEVHKTFGPMFNPATTADQKDAVVRMLGKRFDYLSSTLETRTWLMGEVFTVADAYLFTLLRWTSFTGVDLSKWPALTKYVEKIAERPAVKEAQNKESAVA